MTTWVLPVAAVLSLGLAAAALVRSPRRLSQVAFAVGMAALALEALLHWQLLGAGTAASQARWLGLSQPLALLLPIPWCLFAFLVGRRAAAPVPPGWRLALALGGLGLLAAAGGSVLFRFFTLSLTDGPFEYAHLTPAGQAGITIQLLATIAVLYGLEPSLRNSWGSNRWRLKYLALGLGAIFVARFYLLSQVLLFHLLTRDSLLLGAVTLTIGEILVAVGMVRTEGLRADLAVSRHFVYRSIVVGISGAYLLLAGTAGWLLNTLGIPGAAVWGTLVLFVAILALAALLLSESLRWRLKRYVNTHFYGDKYDYRQQWRSFTASLAARVTLDAVSGQLLRSVLETIGARRAALYLADEPDGALRLQGALNAGPLPKTLPLRSEHLAGSAGAPEARPLAMLDTEAAAPLTDAGLLVAVPLPSQGRLLGVVLVGAERTDAPYTQEDLDLLTTLGEQAAGAIASVQLSERLAQARAFEAFSRLSSFMVHDLKNSIAALSLLTQNARQHFDNAQFRRDALRTLERTVGRMQKLLQRLSSRQAAAELQFERVELGDLARATAESILTGSRVRLTLELERVPAVQGDAEALQRVVQNLITNAVEAMEGEGEITLRVFRQDGMVACAVTDTGCGMPEDFVRTSLFVPFQTTKKGGWGIGLYQAREIMLAHGGRLEVSSEEGRGTTVTLLLPGEAA